MKKLRKKTSVPQLPVKDRQISPIAIEIADDFNNILTTVMGACSLIDRDDAANRDILQCVELIRSSAEHAAELSEQLIHCNDKSDANQAGKNAHAQFKVDSLTPNRGKLKRTDVDSSEKRPGGSKP